MTFTPLTDVLVNVCQPHKPTSKVQGASEKEKEMLCFEMVGLQDFFTASIKKPLALFLVHYFDRLTCPIYCPIFWSQVFVRFFGPNFFGPIYLSYTTLNTDRNMFSYKLLNFVYTTLMQTAQSKPCHSSNALFPFPLASVSLKL